uniref:Secreted protein n=1 Tax=Plectus sambesii TaxID=2011161 RepID=A0A914V5F4_9BILA
MGASCLLFFSCACMMVYCFVSENRSLRRTRVQQCLILSLSQHALEVQIRPVDSSAAETPNAVPSLMSGYHPAMAAVKSESSMYNINPGMVSLTSMYATNGKKLKLHI